MKNLFTLLLSSIFIISSANAQVFWSEDFDTDENFFNWDNEDPSLNNALWTWCEGIAVGPNEFCPSIWDDGLNQQVPFAALTSDNGFITMDSDEVGSLPSNHLSTITTEAIDCLGRSGVGVQFQSHIGVFEVDASTGAIFAVSNNGSDWTDFFPHPELLATSPLPECVDTCRWSSNPLIVDFDISAIADGESEVFLRWQWEGNFEYHWSLDDILVYENNTTGIEQVGDASIGIQISPMPVVGRMDIRLSFADVFETGEIQITNLVGDQIINQRINNNLDQELSIDMDGFASGIYFVSVIADGKVNTKKIILTN